MSDGGAVAAVEVVLSPVEAFDERVDALVDRLRGRPAIDRLMYTASELADFSLLWHLIGTGRGLRSDRHLREAVRLSTVLGLESTVVNMGLKSLFQRDRPIPEFERPHHLRMPLTSSFPSGHASAAFCAAGLLSERNRWGPLYYAAAVVVTTSRVHVKIHHASDVLAGAAVGMAMAVITRRLWRLAR